MKTETKVVKEEWRKRKQCRCGKYHCPYEEDFEFEVCPTCGSDNRNHYTMTKQYKTVVSRRVLTFQVTTPTTLWDKLMCRTEKVVLVSKEVEQLANA